MCIAKNLLRLSAVTLFIFGLSSCSTTATHTAPEPVVIIYHVKPGSEAALQDAIKRAWQIYRREHLVSNEPHICVEIPDGTGKNRFIETFSWVGPFAYEYPSEAVKQAWKQLASLCNESTGGLEWYESAAKPVSF